MVEQTPRNQNSDANNSINRLVDEIAGIATQQWPQAATMLKPVSTKTLFFDGKNEKFELFEELIHTMLKMQPEMTEAMKINHFHAHLRKEALQTFRNTSASNKKTLDNVLIVFRRKHVKPESQATAKHKWHIWSHYKITFWLLRRAQRMCWKSVWWQRPAFDRQLTLRKTSIPFETITKHSLPGKWHIRTNCCTSRKRTE